MTAPSNHLRPHRRAVLAAGIGALAATPVGAADKTFSLADWTRYEIRLRARLADAGGEAFDESAAREILTLTNAVRARARAGACAWHPGLAATARAHAADLASRRYVEHLSPEGFDPSHRLWLMERRMIGSASENIAYRRASDATTPQQLMTLWRGSPKHWENLLNPRHTHAGFGLVRAEDRTYLVGLYAHPAAALSEPLPFRLSDPATIWRTLQGLPGDLRGGVGTPQGAGAGPRGAEGDTATERRSGVYQLNVRRRLDASTYELIGGPIFVWS